MKLLQHVACRVNIWFAICDKWAFWNELLGLTGRHMGELNFLTAPCFKIENCFLTIQIEKEKKMFPQRNRRKSWEESPAVKTQAPETNYILGLNLHGHDLQFLWKIFLLLSSAERLLSEGEQQLLLEHSHSCTSTAAGSDCRDTEPHSLSAVSNMQFWRFKFGVWFWHALKWFMSTVPTEWPGSGAPYHWRTVPAIWRPRVQVLEWDGMQVLKSKIVVLKTMNQLNHNLKLCSCPSKMTWV